MEESSSVVLTFHVCEMGHPCFPCWMEVVEGQISCYRHRDRSTLRHPGASSVPQGVCKCEGTQRLSRRSASPRTGSSMRAGTCLLLIHGAFTGCSVNAIM